MKRLARTRILCRHALQSQGYLVKYSGDFVKYLNRCQYLLQQGLFVADACYYYGDNVPNFAQLKSSDPARVLPRYDYDVINEEVLLNRMQVRDGRLVLPDGMSYRVMVLPGHQIISLEACENWLNS